MALAWVVRVLVLQFPGLLLPAYELGLKGGCLGG